MGELCNSLATVKTGMRRNTILCAHPVAQRRERWVFYGEPLQAWSEIKVFTGSLRVGIALLVKAAIMRIAQRVTNFFRISFTRHLIWAGSLLGFDDVVPCSDLFEKRSTTVSSNYCK